MRYPLAACCCLLLVPAASAQTARHPARTSPARRATASPGGTPDTLPITRVALYKNGVGYFEHSGHVTGDGSVTIDFTSAQLNDVLQTLTAIDLSGGRIAGAGYNSTTPLDQQLKNLPLALASDASDVDFFQAIRGARVQVSGAGSTFTGRLLSIDLRQQAGRPGRDQDRDQSEGPAASTSRRFVTVVSEAGAVRTLELTPGVTVTLLDSALHADVTRYLEVLAANRNDGLRHLTLTDRCRHRTTLGARRSRCRRRRN